MGKACATTMPYLQDALLSRLEYVPHWIEPAQVALPRTGPSRLATGIRKRIELPALQGLSEAASGRKIAERSSRHGLPCGSRLK